MEDEADDEGVASRKVANFKLVGIKDDESSNCHNGRKRRMILQQQQQQHRCIDELQCITNALKSTLG
jgi:hypothetical protein